VPPQLSNKATFAKRLRELKINVEARDVAYLKIRIIFENDLSYIRSVYLFPKEIPSYTKTEDSRMKKHRYFTGDYWRNVHPDSTTWAKQYIQVEMTIAYMVVPYKTIHVYLIHADYVPQVTLIVQTVTRCDDSIIEKRRCNEGRF
jgi:hypothetical protein